MKKLKSRDEWLNEGHSYDNEIENARMMRGSASELVEWANRKIAESRPENFKEGIIKPIQEAKGTPVTQDQWDIEWKIKKTFGKEYDDHFSKRIEAGKSVSRNDDQAEEWAYKNWKQLPTIARTMTLDESKVDEELTRMISDGAMSELHLLAKEAKDEKDFLKKAKDFVKGMGVKFDGLEKMFKALYADMAKNESVNEGKKIKPFKKVKVGDTATDYNGDEYKVIAIGKVKDLAEYDDSGAAEELDPNEDAIALDGRGGTAVFSYDPDGAAVYESVNEGKVWTLIKATKTGYQFLTGKDDGQTTTDLFHALKFDNIHKATKAAREWDKKHNIQTMVHVMNESVNEGKYNSNTDADDIFFLWDAAVDDDREGIEHSHGSSGSKRYSQFIFDDDVKGFDDFEKKVESLLKKNKWKYDFDGDVLNIYEAVESFEGEEKEIKITQKMWDKDWKLAGKDEDDNYEKRVNALLSVFKDPDDAEKHAEKKYNQLPPQASHMAIYESIDENDLGGAPRPVVDKDAWSGEVKTKWTPPKGLFKEPSNKIADELHKESDSLDQAMSRLDFYINRAGKLLDAKAKANLEVAKKLLKQKFA